MSRHVTLAPASSIAIERSAIRCSRRSAESVFVYGSRDSCRVLLCSIRGGICRFDYDVASSARGPRDWSPLRGPPSAARGSSCSRRTAGPGVKILMSGGTRCNITNARGLRRLDVVSGPIDPAYDPAQMPRHPRDPAGVRDNGAFLGPALRRLDVDATRPDVRGSRRRDQDRGKRQDLPGLGPRDRRARGPRAAARAIGRVAPLPEPRAGRSSESRQRPDAVRDSRSGCRTRRSRRVG